MKAWYFAASDRRLRYGDGRKIVVGRTHTVDLINNVLKLGLCKYGLHASEKALDALGLGWGQIAYRVELSGGIIAGEDKLCAEKRKYLVGFDATNVLNKFARLCALDVVHLWDAPDVVKRYLKTGDKTLRKEAEQAADVATHAAAARARAADADADADAAAYATNASRAYAAHAAFDTAHYTAADAAYYTAANAAYAAARNAVRATSAFSAAVCTTAYDTGRAADYDAARAAFDADAALREKQNRRLERMLRQAIREKRRS